MKTEEEQNKDALVLKKTLMKNLKKVKTGKDMDKFLAILELSLFMERGLKKIIMRKQND